MLFEEPGAGGTASTTVASTTHATTTGHASSSSSGAVDCAMVSFDFGAPMGVCAVGHGCDISGSLPDGRPMREHCDLQSLACSLFVDEAKVCDCPKDRIDFASACPNGAPTCYGWLVDYSDIAFCQQ